jgi:mRNA interferase MazF
LDGPTPEYPKDVLCGVVVEGGDDGGVVGGVQAVAVGVVEVVVEHPHLAKRPDPGAGVIVEVLGHQDVVEGLVGAVVDVGVVDVALAAVVLQGRGGVQAPAGPLADAGRGDYILCQITSNPYADPLAIELTDASFSSGSLQRTSYARPGKLFTAHGSLIRATVGVLKSPIMDELRERIVRLLREGK